LGTEIIIIFLPVPFIVWIYNVWCIARNKSRRRHVSLLLLGVVAMLYVLAEVYFSGSPFMQGVLVGSFFYLPFYLMCWLLLYVVGALVPSSALNETNT
jgi:hypothetical protein